MAIKGEVIKCPGCGSLLEESIFLNLLGVFLFFLLFGLILFLQAKTGRDNLRDAGILIVAFLLYFLFRKLKTVQRELIIRNRTTGRISYVSKAEWQEILENSREKAHDFEIVEES
ncbi:MAG: hypothetical protein LWW85_12010 [Marinilabiliales bacterium]|nr:hypothetical protein [Marinilabiliales bacterium]